MRALASYVMKGRSQAMLVAVLATGTFFLSWLAAAVIALVTLRKGVQQGGYLLLWALLPAMVLLWLGDTGPLTSIASGWLVASVLRLTVSWPLALVAATAAGLLTAALLSTVGSSYMETLAGWLEQMLANAPDNPAAAGMTLPTVEQLAGVVGLSSSFVTVLSVLLARWWQSALYNPGGFQQEFHRLRLPPPVTLLLVLVGVLLVSFGGAYRVWALLVAVPFMFAGFALVHGLVAARQMNGNWLGAFYVLWILYDPLKAVLMMLVVVDSWLDFRRLLAQQPRE